jgi:lactate dehydrogenase-like 2-hydroxyacid dehydrogenase
MPIHIAAINQLPRLKCIVVTGSAAIDADACAARGIAVRYLPLGDASGEALVELLEMLVDATGH